MEEKEFFCEKLLVLTFGLIESKNVQDHKPALSISSWSATKSSDELMS